MSEGTPENKSGNNNSHRLVVICMRLALLVRTENGVGVCLVWCSVGAVFWRPTEKNIPSLSPSVPSVVVLGLLICFPPLYT